MINIMCNFKTELKSDCSLLLRQLWASFVIKAEKEGGLGLKQRKPRVQELPEEETSLMAEYCYV